MNKITPHILIACTIDQAMRTAWVDLDWERAGRQEFHNRDGEIVMVVSSFDRLRGYRSDGRILYLGYRWIFAHRSEPFESIFAWWKDAGGRVVDVYSKHSDQMLIEKGSV